MSKFIALVFIGYSTKGVKLAVIDVVIAGGWHGQKEKWLGYGHAGCACD